MQEIWVDIKDFEGIYQVSNLGQVKRLFHHVPIPQYKRKLQDINSTSEKHRRIYNEKIMKLSQDKDGYLILSLKKKMYRLAKLVASHFLDNPYQYTSVTHKDGNFENNTVDNLQWKPFVSDQEKKEWKLKYEREYRKRPKRIGWEQKRRSKDKYINYVTNLNTRFNHGRKAATKRGLSWLLTLEEFTKMSDRPCFYCNSIIGKTSGTALDRINNKLGYELGNVLSCCGICNKIRGDHLTVEEMSAAMKAVLEFRSK